ncbi:glycoside hydrolase family 13 protein [Scatolibacter rhodanostii]|uniref:glycoside hydrolase family 13 protein n=1 Tax=Scatolibacter rhodanostii TaxID=2014781 RepID=UPI000C083833|nr:glycoside hydrolase family 13 protein [Scatolibacter rhodanostii]
MFDSRNLNYKNPFGAVSTGTAVHFKINLPRDFHCSGASLIVENNSDKQVLDLFWCGMNGDSHEYWECHFAPNSAGIYFYHFECRTDRGIRALMRGIDGKAVLQGFDRWQLTVYNDFQTPEWLKGGLIYQIFPDRFYKSDETANTIPYERFIHQNWDEDIRWQPAEDGEIYNDDFFGGNLKGIEEKLPYLQSLGVTCLYLNPIFESHSNHRYDTANYAKIDPLLGTEADFVSLCKTANTLGIHILLDGVFSHTGSDSVYFNRSGRYDSIGAYQSETSPYASWYQFKNFPDDYDCWWGFITLPNVNETDSSYNDYINGENGIVRKWLRLGASGWRLDVADELPDTFLDNLHDAAKAEKPNALIMGEVWEDATNKMAYGSLRRYLLGGQLDSVMNYPFKNAILLYLLEGNSSAFFEIILSIVENYPAESLQVLMNPLGTHDTERILTLLGGIQTVGLDRKMQSEQKLTQQQRELAVKRLKLASLLQYTLPGVPALYYGDEVGMEGCKDPFNRRTFPWGNSLYENEKAELTSWYHDLGQMRLTNHVLKQGNFRKIYAENDVLAYARESIHSDCSSLFVLVNRGEKFHDIGDILPVDGKSILGKHFNEQNKEIGPFEFSVIAY